MIPFRDKRGTNRRGPSLSGLPASLGYDFPHHQHTGHADGGHLPEQALTPGTLLVRHGADATLDDITADAISAHTLTLSALLTLNVNAPEIAVGLNTFGYDSADGDGRALFPEDPDATAAPHVVLVGTDLNPVNLTAQTGNIAATSLIGGGSARAPRGLWLISVVHTCTSAGAAGSLATTIGFTDANGAQTVKPAADLVLTGTGYAAGSAIIEKAALATDITYATAITGGAGSPAYRLAIRATLIG